MNYEKCILKEFEKIFKLRKKIGEINKNIDEYRKLLGNNCTHSDISEYEWEFDSGYGVQTRHKGNRCNICLKVDTYKNGRWFTPDYGD